jgi:hypothetical protein
VDRLRCSHCRNPIKPQHATAGPSDSPDSYHEDCWSLAQQVSAASALEQQLAYQRRVAAEGLSALLAPYVSAFAGPLGDPDPASDPLPT